MKQNKVIVATGRTYAYVDAKSTPSPRATLLCLHGFPDQWYGWEHQITAWSKAGYRVLVPHMLGYGQTDKPQDIEAYSTKNLCADLAAFLDALGLFEPLVVIGHDWGAAVAWRFLLWYPERLKLLINMSVPYFPPWTTYIPIEEASRRVPSFAYQEYFASPESTAQVERALSIFLPALFQGPRGFSGHQQGSSGENISILRPGQMKALINDETRLRAQQPTLPPMVISPEELNRYRADFEQGGMHGPLSYYRNTRSRYDDELQLLKRGNRNRSSPSKPIPILFIYGSEDKTCPENFVKRMPQLITKSDPNVRLPLLYGDLKMIKLDGVGHWVLLEAKERVTNEVLSFLEQNLAGRTALPLAKL